MAEKPDLAALFGASPVTTFLGVEPASCDTLDAQVALFGAPGATPYGSVGAYCKNAPAALRRASGALAANVERHDFDIGGAVFPTGLTRPVDLGDLPFDATDFAANRQVIRDTTHSILTAGGVPVMLGGDDSTPIPMLEAFAGRPITILQIDAHIDWREAHMGETLGLSSPMRRASEMAHVAGIVQVGARGLGSAHSDDLADAQSYGAHIITARDLHRDGVMAALDLLPEGVRLWSVWMSTHWTPRLCPV